ncbi:hypothetical protein D046_8305B, partial [Vibrio parahaemolyticus V-223/04]
PIR